jgi:hypothetical protein
MNEIIISAVVGDDHRLVVDLPMDAPTGDVEVVIRPAKKSTGLTREEARARLLAGGALVTSIYAPEGTKPLTLEERMRLGTLPPGSRPSEVLIDEDRGEY